MAHHQGGVLTAAKPLENGVALFDRGLVGNGGDQERLGNFVDGGVVVGKHQGAIRIVLGQQLGQHPQLALGTQGDRPRLPMGQHGPPPALGLGTGPHKPLPSLGRAEPDVGLLQKLIALGDQLVVARSLLGREFDLDRHNLKGGQGISGEVGR